ncbi:hypothetical protein [Francisella hispaniensis]|uniref:Uncharacterized protein n=1 Tax=Francisella hispaniensis TaxID=622488 RepID=F4BFU7_9GAMM|nr:hypothetical protein [Francisella hispaniensis]AEE26341.1 hypothetical protein FN3523_1038 [Francisella hispaniensis]
MFFIIPFIYYSDSYSNLNSQLISIAIDGEVISDISRFTKTDGTQINVGLSDRVRNVIEKTAILEALNGDRLLDYQIRDYGSSWGVFVRSGSEVFDFAGGGATVRKGSTVTLDDWDFHRLADNARATHISEGYASALNSIKESVETSFVVREIQPFLLENLSFELDEAGEVALNFDGINEFKLVA